MTLKPASFSKIDSKVKSQNARLLLVLTALCWSSGGILIKLVSAGPLVVAGVRSLIAGCILFAVFRPKIKIRSLPLFLGAFSYALTVLMFVAATKMTSAANAILLQSTAPIYVALFGGIYLKEKLRTVDILAMVGVFAGMLFFFKGELTLQGMWGNLLGLASGFAFAWFILFTRKFHSHSTMAMIIEGNFLAAILALPIALFLAARSNPDLISHPNWSALMLSGRDWCGLLLLGSFQLALPYALYAKAIPYLSALDTVLIVLIEPILNPIWVFIFLGERPDFWAIVGGVLVFGSVTARSLWIMRRS